MHHPKYPVAFFLFAALMSSCFLLPRQEETLAPPLMETPKIAYDTAVVRKGTIEDVVTVPGIFVNRERTSVYFAPRGGFIKDIRVGVGSTVKRGEILAELDTRELEYNYRIQELALKKAELKYKKNSTADFSAVDQELALIELEEQRLKTEQAKKDLDSAIIRAPFDGIIVFKDSDYSRGDEIEAYVTILQIALPGTLEIMYEGSRMDVFYQGMPVEIIMKDGKNYKAEVIQTPRDTPQSGKKDFTGAVFFRLNKSSADVRRGMKCDVKITLDRKESTLIIPKNLVQTDNGVSFVYVLENDLPSERVVETGITSSTEIEILKGLSEGDQIIKR
jgi:RND family efflux transporter MFP subunit